MDERWNKTSSVFDFPILQGPWGPNVKPNVRNCKRKTMETINLSLGWEAALSKANQAVDHGPATFLTLK